MPHLRNQARLIAVGVACAGLGAGVSAIATAGAASSHEATPRAAHDHFAHRFGARLGRAVHGEVVVSTANGFKTITFDRGFVQSVSGSTLTMREGTATATYKTVTLTIPAGARVRNNREAASLSSLTPGEHVLVLQRPAGTAVIAHRAQ